MKTGAPLLEARDLARHYVVSRGLFKHKGLVRALDGVSFSLREGKTLAVVGESGCGKSTLARQVTMIERPTSGSLLLDGNDVAHANVSARKKLRPRVQMVFHPQLVVADEPVSALDVSIQAQVLNLLMDLQQEMGIAYLFISHNLQVVRHIANDVLVMYLGRTVEYASKDDVFSRPAHPYTRALLASTPSLTAGRTRARAALM